MEFINKMKKREIIEMGLKALAALLVAFVAIILMEGMIYSIQLNAVIKNSPAATTVNQSTQAYCIEQGEDQYIVIYHYYNEFEDTHHWTSTKETKSKAECLKIKESGSVTELAFHAPNAFEFSITPIHFVVMAVFISAVAGFFAYKFIALTKSYKKIEEEFNKTGTIAITNI